MWRRSRDLAVAGRVLVVQFQCVSTACALRILNVIHVKLYICISSATVFKRTYMYDGKHKNLKLCVYVTIYIYIYTYFDTISSYLVSQQGTQKNMVTWCFVQSYVVCFLRSETVTYRTFYSTDMEERSSEVASGTPVYRRSIP